MPLKHSEVFRQIDPPSGGLNRLHQRLADERGRFQWKYSHRLALVISLVIVVVAIGYSIVRFDEQASFPSDKLLTVANPAVLRYGVASSIPTGESASVLVPHKTALMPVPSPNDDVIFYWVVSISGGHKPQERQ